MPLSLPAVHRRRTARRKLGLGLACFAALALQSLHGAHATTMTEVSLDHLIARSHLVIRGDVVRTGTRVTVKEGALEARTHVWIRVHEAMGGDVKPGALVHLWEPGGRYGDVLTRVAGAPRYLVHEEVVVFLVEDEERAGRYRTLEMTQGKYHVFANDGHDPMVTRDLSEVSLVKWRKRRLEMVEAPTQPPLRLQTLRARVKALWLPRTGARKGGVR